MTVHVLILCTHNSARSVLAEGMLNHWARQRGCDVQAHSAGSAPSGRVHPLALDVLTLAGVDTAGLRSKNWDEFSHADAPPLSIVVTVCDAAAAEICPVFFGGAGGPPAKTHWGYADPAKVTGRTEARRRAFELTRQALGYRLLLLLDLLNLLGPRGRQGLQGLSHEATDRAALEAALATIGRS